MDWHVKMVAWALCPARQCGLNTDGVSLALKNSDGGDGSVAGPTTQRTSAISVVTGSNELPAGLGAPVPGSRTESPQPVSSARRRLSTDEMQLREVGKLAVYLRKMRWLQRPSHRALPWAVWCGWLTPGMAALLGLVVLGGLAAACTV